jgi:hypothetical protein
MYPFPTLSPCSHHRFLRPQSTLRSSLLFTQTLRLLPTSSLLLLLSLTSHRNHPWASCTQNHPLFILWLPPARFTQTAPSIHLAFPAALTLILCSTHLAPLVLSTLRPLVVPLHLRAQSPIQA